MPREYEVQTCPECGRGVGIEPTDGGVEQGDFEAGVRLRKPLPVTAVDLRDVEPLIKAARSLAVYARGTSPEGNPYTMVPAKQLRALLPTLNAFEEDS